jgi:hypothetical protein
MQFLRQEEKENIRKYIDEKLPLEYQKCLVGIDSILARTWDIANNRVSRKRQATSHISRNAGL